MQTLNVSPGVGPDPVLAAAAAVSMGGQRAALVTVVGVDGSAPRRAGARMLVYEDGGILGTVGGGAFEHRLRAEAAEAITTGQPRRVKVHLTRDLGMCCGGAMDALVEPLAPIEPLVVHGAGHVGREVARLAAAMGFAVTLVDDREEWIAPPEVPDGVRRVEADSRRLLEQLPLGPSAMHLIVTHDHRLDQELVEALMVRDLRWLGMIGSHTKRQKFKLRFAAAGADLARFEAVRCPVGLDIGAETPREIALSIVGELVMLRRTGRAGAEARVLSPR